MSVPLPQVGPAGPALRHPPCILCGGDDFTPLLPEVRDEIWRRPGRFQVQRCRCGMVMTRPRPAEEALGQYYQGAYSGDGSFDMGAFNQSFGGRILSLYRLATIEKVRRLGPEDAVLDVGCSQGHFLARVRQDRAARTAGIDLDPGSIAVALEPDRCEYRVGRLAEANWPDGSFSVVSFFECLEHETDPIEALRKAHRLLKPGGLCIVEVPDWGSPWRAIFGRYWLPLLIPQHLSHFSKETLARAMEAAGFVVVHRQSMLFPVELTGSLLLWLASLFDLPRVPDEEKSIPRRLLELSVGLLLMTLFWTVDLPSQFLLRILGRTGHQAMIGQKRSG